MRRDKLLIQATWLDLKGITVNEKANLKRLLYDCLDGTFLKWHNHRSGNYRDQELGSRGR